MPKDDDNNKNRPLNRPGKKDTGKDGSWQKRESDSGQFSMEIPPEKPPKKKT